MKTIELTEAQAFYLSYLLHEDLEKTGQSNRHGEMVANILKAVTQANDAQQP